MVALFLCCHLKKCDVVDKNKINSHKLNIHNIILNLTLKIINFQLPQWWGNEDWRTDHQKTKSAISQ